MITPYSNWRGPVWINSNVVLSYGALSYGYTAAAFDIANRVIAVLANDLTNTSTWHECYSSGT